MSELQLDSNVLSTINGKASEKTPFNITLRPESLFAGKTFSEDGLAAADAIIISVFYPFESNESEIWNERVSQLKETGQWEAFLGRDGHSSAYEFKLSSVSHRSDLLFAIAYTMMLARVIYSLGKVQAIRSRYVLLPGIVMQVSNTSRTLELMI